MQNFTIPYTQTGYYSKLILDYLSQEQSVEALYHRFPEIDQFEAQIATRKNSFTNEHRKQLVTALETQYQTIQLDKLTQQNITNLVLPNTFTITTGHQLNIFSGPLYFLYKIISVINLCKTLKDTYPKQNFVPVFWMATEDHDFEEIQYLNTKGKKISWNYNFGGPVGKYPTDSMEQVYKEFEAVLNSSQNATYLKSVFKKAYCSKKTLADATRILVNDLFGKDGLVVIDGDDELLKSSFKSYVYKELTQQITLNEVTKTNEILAANGYHQQVKPREINLFLQGLQFRERIIPQSNGKFTIHNTNLEFQSAEELVSSVFDKNDYTISGNALLRPLYQEVVLPNLCYVGGAGEIAYWLQLKSTFEAFEVPFPMLLMRNAALIVNEKQFEKSKKLQLTWQELFLKPSALIQHKVKQLSQQNIDFQSQQQQLQTMFELMKKQISKTDASFEGAVLAQEKKQMKGLQNLEKRWLKAEKRRLYDVLTRIEILQQSLFPNGNLQERVLNFTEFYEANGEELLLVLKENLNPLDYHHFNLIVL